MATTIITIARQYGSGGRTVGHMLSAQLGIPYYDRDIITMASEDSGINARLFTDEKLKSPLRSLIRPRGIDHYNIQSPESAGFTKDDNLFAIQAKIRTGAVHHDRPVCRPCAERQAGRGERICTRQAGFLSARSHEGQ